jgi:hypothetical protein
MDFQNLSNQPPEYLKSLIEHILKLHPELVKECRTMSTRIFRHGDPTCKKPYRQPMSESHKKRVKENYTKKLKEERAIEKERLKTLGLPIKKRGRPKGSKAGSIENQEL